MFIDLKEEIEALFEAPEPRDHVPCFTRLAPETIDPADFAKMERDARAKFATLAAQDVPSVTAGERQEQKNAEGRRARAAGRKEKPRDRRAYDRTRYLSKKAAACEG